MTFISQQVPIFFLKLKKPFLYNDIIKTLFIYKEIDAYCNTASNVLEKISETIDDSQKKIKITQDGYQISGSYGNTRFFCISSYSQPIRNCYTRWRYFRSKIIIKWSIFFENYSFIIHLELKSNGSSNISVKKIQNLYHCDFCHYRSINY